MTALRASLESLVAETAKAPSSVKAVVIISGKERIFVAGADLKWLANLPDAGAAKQASRDGQRLFDLIAALRVPVVCAIHGACAGGGYELALACTWRLATDAAETRIGLPEVGLGLIPAWGGGVRLARLIGIQPAAEFILRSALVPSSAAQSFGLVDEVVPVTELRMRAKSTALRLAGSGSLARVDPPSPSPEFFAQERQSASKHFHGQPAPLAVLEVLEKSARMPLAVALEIEAEGFGRVAAGEVAKKLLHLFQLREKARKASLDAWFPAPSAPAGAPANIRTVGIVGSGVMGSAIAHWCAAHGYGVIMCDANRAAIERGVTIIRELFAANVKRGELSYDVAHRLTGGIGITTSLEDFEYCDVVIEAIVEDRVAKQKLFAELSAIIKPDCILASNSSTLPIEELATSLSHPERAIGFHFFNPVGRTPLIELAIGPQTSRATAERMLAMARNMTKTPVICRSSSGHFVTRVVFVYLNEACRLWEQGASISLIDQAMGEAGWAMGPMRFIDEIGVDVTAAIFDELARSFPERFKATKICGQMLAGGLFGRKTKAGPGFYDYVDGVEAINPALAKFATNPANHKSWETKTIQDLLNAILADEARRAVADGVVKTSDDANLALILGAGFPAFRGGVLSSAKAN